MALLGPEETKEKGAGEPMRAEVAGYSLYRPNTGLMKILMHGHALQRLFEGPRVVLSLRML